MTIEKKIIIIIIIIIIIKNESAVQDRERVRPPQHNQPTGEKKREKSRSGQKQNTGPVLKTRQSHASNTGSLRSFQWDTESSSKVLRYWDGTVLRYRGANECLWATKAPRVTRAGTYGKGNVPLKGCIGLLLILNSKHNSATDRRWARLQFKTPPAKNQHSWQLCPLV